MINQCHLVEKQCFLRIPYRLFLFTSLFKYSNMSFLFWRDCFVSFFPSSTYSFSSSGPYWISSALGSLSLASSYITFLYFVGCFCLKYFVSLLKYSCCCCFWYCWYLCFYYFQWIFLIRCSLSQQNRNFLWHLGVFFLCQTIACLLFWLLFFILLNFF